MCKAYLGEIHSHEDRATVFGKFNAFSSAAFIFGPLLGGYIADLPDGFDLVCAFAATTFVLNLCK